MSTNPQPMDIPDLTGRASVASTIARGIMDALACGLVVFLAHTLFKQTSMRWFPNQSDWDGLEMLGALRLYHGQTLYPIHAMEGTFYPYGPVPPILHALGMWLRGPEVKAVLLLRNIFFVLTVVALIASCRTVSGSLRPGILGAALFLGINFLHSRWVYSARPDIPAVCFTAWGTFFLLRSIRTPSASLAAAAMLCSVLAAFSKANYALFLPAFAAFLLPALPRRQWVLALLPALGVGSMLLGWFNTGGEHFLKNLAVMSAHPWRDGKSLLDDLFTLSGKHFFYGIILALPWLSAGWEKTPAEKRTRQAFVLLLLTAGVAASIPFMKLGGAPNSFYPFEMLLGTVAGLALHDWRGKRVSFAISLPVACFLAHVLLSVHATHADNHAKADHAHLGRLAKFNRAHPEIRIYAWSYEYLAVSGGENFQPSGFLVIDREYGGEPYPELLRRRIEARGFDYLLFPPMPALIEPQFWDIFNTTYRAAEPDELPEALRGWHTAFVPRGNDGENEDDGDSGGTGERAE